MFYGKFYWLTFCVNIRKYNIQFECIFRRKIRRASVIFLLSFMFEILSRNKSFFVLYLVDYVDNEFVR